MGLGMSRKRSVCDFGAEEEEREQWREQQREQRELQKRAQLQGRFARVDAEMRAHDSELTPNSAGWRESVA